MDNQFLTAVFQLRPSKSKACILEASRLQYQKYFWKVLRALRADAEQCAKLAGAIARKSAAKSLKDRATKMCDAAHTPDLQRALRDGLIRDIRQQLTSYFGLIENEIKANARRAKQMPPKPPQYLVVYPKESKAPSLQYEKALDALCVAVTDEECRNAEAQLRKVPNAPDERPFVLCRHTDGCVSRGRDGKLVALLKLNSNETPKDARYTLEDGVDPTTGEVINASGSRSYVPIPLSCNTWLENKFLSGRALLRSSLVFRRGDQWYFSGQFEMLPSPTFYHENFSDCVLGIDRGIVNPVAFSVVDKKGNVLHSELPEPGAIHKYLQVVERKRAAAQKRTEKVPKCNTQYVEQMLHRIANQIVAAAVKYRARVVLEDLEGLKATITTKRQQGARRNPWQKSLKKAQLGKLESILKYKLALHGLPEPLKVLAAGTSITCAKCGHHAKENRQTQDKFVCVACGHEAHADKNASVIIARRLLIRDQYFSSKGTWTGLTTQANTDMHAEMVKLLAAKNSFPGAKDLTLLAA